MGLCNVYSYLNDKDIGKTIKLSDSYQVKIKLADYDFSKSRNNIKNKYALDIAIPENNEIELYECTSVKLPAYKIKEDIFEYGNNSKSFIYMDPTSLDDLEIEVIEHYVNSEKNTSLAINNIVNLFLSKLFDENTFEYKLDDYIPELIVYVFSNIFDTVYLKYVFKDLKLTDYTKYDLDYSSTDLAKWSLKFAYRSFYVITGEENEYKKEIITSITENTVINDNKKLNEEVKLPEIANTPEQVNNFSDSNNDLKNEFNATAQIPTGIPKNNDTELVLNNVLIKSNNTANPVDLSKLSSKERVDELAYRMMRGELDNGKPRFGKTYDAGYTEKERSMAQKIVNKKDWQGLKERHDARVDAINQELTANITEINHNEITQPEKTNQSKKAAVNSYSNDTGTKYINGEVNENGLTLNQWAYLSAKRDFEEEENKNKRNATEFRGINFSVGASNLPKKEKMNFQKKYKEEMKKQQNTEI